MGKKISFTQLRKQKFFIIIFIFALWSPLTIFFHKNELYSQGYANPSLRETAIPPMSCKDFESPIHDESFFKKMDLLAKKAKFIKPWHRGTESFIYEICHNDFKGANRNVLYGITQIDEAMNIAKILGVNYIPPKRNSDGLLYEMVNNKLCEFMCVACASNAADYFVKYPNSEIGILIKRAIDGDNEAIAILSDPSWATPRY